ncbi:Tetratricopeptide TPR_2 repeat-containing protein [Sphingobium chlorophenolicum L-1]|uniref:Tetratricopeptide TPR_2 repeat-containing protein n=1 Tax=Sphingobium chlorophenolicum L-1 TaxID=690566 RepID=F6EW18_SPHCR|nr:tetratricopeptide repeat protein [Sphingobium chlorophenolicum]AEG48064.1 Tetratricopeptide TPR_2 repeat-containing protein [Sphingobium chlorophenolicum L-1]
MKKGVLAVALIMATAACASPQKGVLSIRPVNQQAGGAAQDALARGDLLFTRGEYALALDAFRRAVRNDPADAHGLNGVAISYAAMGRHDLAREFFELALARAPQDARIARNFARSLLAQGLKEEADVLLAQAGGVMTGMPRSMRPTLAQLASAALAARPALLAGVELERVSLGEVRLRTMETSAPAERIRPQLTTRIVTGEEAKRELTAPIITVDRPETVARPNAGIAGARPEPQANDGTFERLWRSIMRPAGRKGERG